MNRNLIIFVLLVGSLGALVTVDLPLKLISSSFDRAELVNKWGFHKIAAHWYRDAAIQNNPVAQLRLGFAHHLGQGVAQDYDTAVEWYRKAANQGNLEAKISLAWMARGGKKAVKNNQSASKWYLRLKNVKDPEVLLFLGEMAENGGLARHKEAVRYYRRAAEQGNAIAAHKLAAMYALGKGIERSQKDSFKWFLKSAEQGYREAQFELSMIHFRGDTVTQNFEEAFKWALKAASQGLPSAEYYLGYMYSKGYGTTKDLEASSEWLHRSARSGDVRGQMSLGKLYHEGIAVPKNGAEAARWYRKAANQGNEEALSILKTDSPDNAKWEHNGKVISPECFPFENWSQDNFEAIAEYHSIEYSDDFSKNTGKYFGREITTFEAIEEPWTDGKYNLHIIRDLESCLHDERNIEVGADGFVTYTNPNPRLDVHTIRYKQLKDLPLQLCEELKPNLKATCMRASIFLIGDWEGGSRGTAWQTMVFGMIKMPDGKEYIAPLKSWFGNSEEEALEFFNDWKALKRL